LIFRFPFRKNADFDRRITLVEKQLKQIMATIADLDAAIAALPAKIASALEAKLAPIIADLVAKAGPVDLSAEIASLNALPDSVATQVTTDLTTPPPAPAP